VTLDTRFVYDETKFPVLHPIYLIESCETGRGSPEGKRISGLLFYFLMRNDNILNPELGQR